MDDYKEIFRKGYVENNPKSIKYVLEEIKELYSESNGWIIGNPVIIPNNEEKTVTIEVELTKKRKNEISHSK